MRKSVVLYIIEVGTYQTLFKVVVGGEYAITKFKTDCQKTERFFTHYKI